MSTETNSSTGDVTPELSNQELDRFFETQGESFGNEETATEDESEDNAEDSSVGSATDSKEEESEIPEPVKGTIDYNYKKMADEERGRRKEAQAQIDSIKAENEKLKETFNKVMRTAQEKADKENIPNYDDDPLAALKYENEQLRSKIDPLEKAEQNRQQNYTQQQQQKKFISEYAASADEFKETTPDFDDAYDHLVDSRMKDYIASGYSKEEAANLLQEDEIATVIKARQQGVNPAERIYALAKIRGYNGNKKSDADNFKSQIAKNTQKINQLERGVKASKTLSDSGTHSDERLTLETISQMDDDEFSKVDWNKVLKMG